MSVTAPSAAQSIGEYLQSPDDLAKIAAFRKKLEKEKASIDTRLRSGVKEQLDATRSGLSKLFATRNNVQAIKDELAQVDQACRDPKNVVATFDQISRVSMVHRNFEQTEEIVNNLLDMSEKLQTLEDMVAADRSDILGGAPNLLAVHYQLTQLEAFRNQTMHQAKKASAASRNTLARCFERLNNLTEAFEELLMELARMVLPLVRAGHPEVVVKLVKIAEVEGREDEKAIAIRLVKKAAKMDAASKFKSMQANARQLKHYRPKLIKAITESIKSRFNDAYAKDERTPSRFFDNLSKWMYQDLVRIERDVIMCFPPSWEIHNLFVREYHRALDATIRKVLEKDPEASLLLVIHGWLKEYKQSMAELDVPPELLEPPLLDGKEQNLIEDYLSLIVSKLSEWSTNLIRTELAEFTTRSSPPELDADNMYSTQGPVILFQMVNQQVDVAAESGQGGILARVVGEAGKVMRELQEQWVKALEGEFKKQTEKPDEVAGGFVEYCIALANDQIKSADYAEGLLNRLEPLVSEKYRVQINDRLNDAIDGYLDVAKKCIQTLIGIVFNDLKPATKQLFQPTWYDGIMRQIVETIRDYMTDYQTYLNPTLLDLLVDDLVDTFLVTYLTALANGPKLKMPAAVDRIRDDVIELIGLFSTFKPIKELEQSFDVVDMILGLLEASKSMAFLSFWSFAKVHGPNLAFVESLMRLRSDLDRSDVSEVMDSVKRKVKDEEVTDPPEPTIMKKITIQSTLSRFLRT